MSARNRLVPILILLALQLPAAAGDGNRLSYLDGPCNPYYPNGRLARLATPQWFGQGDVDAVVVLAIDDLRDTPKYETYLRPILDRLKQIDGRAPVSIMTCRVDPADGQLQVWLREGLSIEVHTVDHPCPLLQRGDLAKAKSTYDRCLDLLSTIPGNRPVAFRMPCCDSQNTPSPRFWTEIFNHTTPNGRFLAMDSSVFNLLTPGDGQLPRELVLDEDGRERFRKYLPRPSFVNWIENYPYPYVIDHLCWEMPCVVPSDWEAQNLHKPSNPKTVQDWCAALDAIAERQGVFVMVFHPHGWIRSDQVVELIEHAVRQYGRRIRFLTFREVLDRINRHLLDGHPLRRDDGGDSGVRVLDVNNDGFMDVVYREGPDELVTRLWQPERKSWVDRRQAIALDHPHFGVIHKDGRAAMLLAGSQGLQLYHWHENQWQSLPVTVATDRLSHQWQEMLARPKQLDGMLLRDLDGDGLCELLAGKGDRSLIFRLASDRRRWIPLPFGLPAGVPLAGPGGRDVGLRLVDVDSDGQLDCLFSDGRRYSLHLLQSLDKGWSEPVLAGVRQGDKAAVGPVIPMIVRPDGTNNGTWFHGRQLWVQNEDTSQLPDGVDRLAFDEMLADYRRRQARAAPATAVGVARVDITPEAPIRLHGYGSRRSESEGVAQRIWAKAMAIGPDEGDGPAVLLTVENCGMTPEIRQLVARQLAERAGLRPERLAICVTHTHTAPCLRGWAPFIFGTDFTPAEQQRIDQYTRRLTKQLVEVALAALSHRQPARLFWTQGRVSFAANRRVLHDGRWTGFGVQPDGPVDHSLPVLVAKSPQGELLAVVANYACHCTTLGGKFNQICGDWAGFAQQFVEEKFPGAMCLITIGCGADANPNPRGELEMCRQHGQALAEEVARLLRGPLTPVSAQLQCRWREIQLPFDTLPTRAEWEQRARQSGVVGYHARKMLQRLDAGQAIPTTLRYPVASWIFGDDLAMVLLPGEVVVDYAIRLKKELDEKRIWITAYANEVPCYIASRRVLREGGYEADRSMLLYARPTRLAAGAEDLIIETVRKLVPAGFYAQAGQLDFAPQSIRN